MTKQLTPEDQEFWDTHIALGRLIHGMLKRDPDRGKDYARKYVDDVTPEEAAQFQAIGVHHDTTWVGFAPIPYGRTGVLAHREYYWSLTGDRLIVTECLC